MRSILRTTASCTLGALMLSGLSAPAAAADEHRWLNWYLGVNVGQARATIDEPRIVSSLAGNGFTTTAFTEDDRETGSKFYLGYRFNPYFALEGGYFDLGTFDFMATTLPAGSFGGNMAVRGVNIDAVGRMPFSQSLSAIGRLGYIVSEADDHFAGTGAVNVLTTRARSREGDFKAGIGLQYDHNQDIAWRLEAERYRVDDAVGNVGDIDLISLGLIMRFGYIDQPMQHAEPAPYIAPEPVLVVVPVTAATERYCSILDIQFEINADEMQRADEEKLAVLGTFLEKYPNTTGVIEGHTDDVGSDADNQALSQRRAQAVVDYLVTKYPINRSRLQARGYGSQRPLASNDTQAGQRINRRIGALIACATDIEGLKPLPARVTMAMLLEFGVNSAEIRPAYREDLRRIARYLDANPTVTATIEGHTGDVQGTRETAMQVSQRRAQAVLEYLVREFGVSRSRLSTEGFGQTRRFAYNTSLEAAQENRRVNILINYPN